MDGHASMEPFRANEVLKIQEDTVRRIFTVAFQEYFDMRHEWPDMSERASLVGFLWGMDPDRQRIKESLKKQTLVPEMRRLVLAQEVLNTLKEGRDRRAA